MNRLTVLRAYTTTTVESSVSKEILSRTNELRGTRETLRNEKDDTTADIADVLVDLVSAGVSSLARRRAGELDFALYRTTVRHVFATPSRRDG